MQTRALPSQLPPPPHQSGRRRGPHYSVLGPGMHSLRESLPGQFCTEETLPLLLKSVERRENELRRVVSQSQSFSESLPSEPLGNPRRGSKPPNPQPGTLGPSYSKAPDRSRLTSLPSCFWHFQDGPSFLTSRPSQGANSNPFAGQLSWGITQLLPLYPRLPRYQSTSYVQYPTQDQCVVSVQFMFVGEISQTLLKQT